MGLRSPVQKSNRLSKILQKMAGSLAALLALVAQAGCTTPEVCATLGTCGGDLLGGQASKQWNVDAACVNDLASAPLVPQLLNQPPTLQGEVPPKRTQVNWCSELRLEPDKSINFVQVWFPALPVESGNITFSDSGSYTGTLTSFGPLQQDFAAGCFFSQGVKIVPDGADTKADELTCEQFTTALATGTGGYATQPNILKDDHFKCVNDGAGGCQCLYNLRLFAAIEGKYATVGNVVNFFDKTKNFVSSADYCVLDNTLELSGYKRKFLFNQAGVRSLTLTAAPGN
jgi:hypothetical protein